MEIIIKNEYSVELNDLIIKTAIEKIKINIDLVKKNLYY